MAKISQVIAILFFAFVMRGLLGVFVIHANLDSGTAFYASLIINYCFNLLLIWGSIKALNLDYASLKIIWGGRPTPEQLIWGTLFGFILLFQTLGENALEVIAVSSVDKELAYGLWKFMPVLEAAPPFLSSDVILFLLNSVVLVPIAEEFFFRGLVLRAFNAKFSFFAAAALSSLSFMILHVGNNYHITAFLFSFILSYVYAVSRSLFACIVAHAVYNLAAHVGSNYIGFHSVRTVNQLDSLVYWMPQLWMLAVSIVFLAVVMVKWQSKIKGAAIVPLTDQRTEGLHRGRQRAEG